MQDIEVCLDVLCLASRLTLENGGETYRAEETVLKMAQGFGFDQIEVFALPTAITISLSDMNGAGHTRIVRVHQRSIDLKKLNECNQISRSVFEKRMTVDEALKNLHLIDSMKKPQPWVLIMACALSSAFFTVMFEGGAADFAVSAVCGVITECILLRLAARYVPALFSGMIAGFTTAFIALAANRLFPVDVHIEPIISGAIMPLLPGLSFTAAVRDTIRGDLVSGSAKVTEAILCAVTLGSGIAIMISLWGEFFG